MLCFFYRVQMLCVCILALVCMWWSVFAIQRESNEIVQIREPMDETLFVAWNTVDVDATIAWDLFGAGQQMHVWGTVTEDAWLAWNIVTVKGKIWDDLRAVWNKVSVLKPVVGDVMIAAREVRIEASVWWDMMIWADTVRLLDEVSWDVHVEAEYVEIGAPIWSTWWKWNVTIAAGELVFGPWGAILGDLDVVTGTQMPENIWAYVKWTTSIIPEHEWSMAQWSRESMMDNEWRWYGWEGEWASAWRWFDRLSWGMMSVVWMILILLMPQFFSRTMKYFDAETRWKPLIAGFLLLLVIPVVAIVLMVTLFGAPLGGLIFANYLFLRWFLGVFGAIGVAYMLVERVLYRYIWADIWPKIAVMVLLCYVFVQLPMVVSMMCGMAMFGAMVFASRE